MTRYLLLLFLTGCSLQSGFTMKCEGKCEAAMHRDADIDQPQGLSK